MENTISWTVPNLITVTLMVMVTFVVAAFVYRIARAALPKGKAAPDAPEAA